MNPAMDYCQNCKRDISKDNFITHSAHCHRNIEVCTICKEPVPIKEMSEHVAEMHSTVSCEKCNKKMEKWKLQDHESSCVKRLIDCQYCEINCSWDEIKDHESYCGARTEQCSECQEYIMIKNKSQHDKEKCSNLKMNLSYVKHSVICQYCGAHFLLDKIKEHESYCGSRTEQCSECQQPILITNKAQHKEKCSNLKIKGKDRIFCFNCKSFILGNFTLHEILCFDQKNNSFKELKSKNAERKSPDDEISQVTSSLSKLSTSENHRNLNSPATNKTSKMSGTYSKSCLSPQKVGNLFSKQSQNGEITNDERNFSHTKNGSRLHKIQNSGYHSNDCEPHSNDTLLCTTCCQNVKMFEYNSHVERCGRKPVECEICNVTVLAANLKKHKESCFKKKFLFGQNGNMDDSDSLILKGGMLRCPACKEQFTTFEMKDHRIVCRPKMEKCHICQEEILVSQLIAHQELCLKINMPSVVQKVQEASITSLKVMDTIGDIPVELDFASSRISPKKFLVESMDIESVSARSELQSAAQNDQMLSKESSLKVEEKPVSVRRKTRPFNSSLQAVKQDEVCPRCKDSFSASEISSHMSHCILLREECIVCNRKIQTSRLKRHQEECFKSVELPVQEENNAAKTKKLVKECYVDCKTCKNTFSLSEIDSHMSQCRQDFRICVICEKRIVSSELETHKMTCVKEQPIQQRSNGNKTYHQDTEDLRSLFQSCSRCDSLVSNEYYNDHVSECTEDLKACFICDVKILVSLYEQHVQGCAIKLDSAIIQAGVTNTTTLMTNRQKRKYVKSSENFSKNVQDFPPLKSPLKTADKIEVVSLPCEFCEKLFPEYQLIQHQSGCQPELLHYPPAEEEYFSASESFDYGKKMKPEKKKAERDKNTQPGEFLMTQQQNSQSQTFGTTHTEETRANTDLRHPHHGYPFADVASHNFSNTSAQGSKNNPSNTLLQTLDSRRENMKSSGTEVKSCRNEFSTLSSESTFTFRKSCPLDLNKADSLPVKDLIAKRLDKFDDHIQVSNCNDLSTYLQKSNEGKKIQEKMAVDHIFNPGVDPKSQKKEKKKKIKGKRKGRR